MEASGGAPVTDFVWLRRMNLALDDPMRALGTWMKSRIVHNSFFIYERFIYDP